jgi:hypothetical protein
MTTYIAQLFDHGALSEPITWRTESIAEARELLVNVGAWQSSPDGGGQILLSESAYVMISPDVPGLDLARTDVSDNLYANLLFDRGPRGGIRRVEV